MNKYLQVLFLLGVASILTPKNSLAVSRFQSIETVKTTEDDGKNSITEIKEKSIDDFGRVEKNFDRSYLVSSPPRRQYRKGKQQQTRSNQIMTDLEDSQSRFFFPWDNNNFFRYRGFVSRARSVESPALSVDSGGRSTNRISSEIAKIFNVKPGYYSDVYDGLGSKSNFRKE